jgi:hypothetical protein
MGFQFTISAETQEEFTQRIVGFYQAIKSASDVLFKGEIPPIMPDAKQAGADYIGAVGPEFLRNNHPDSPDRLPEAPVEPAPKRRGRPPKPQTIDVVATEVKTADPVGEALEVAGFSAEEVASEPELITTFETWEARRLKADIDLLLPQWNSDMKQKPAAVVAAKVWLLDNNTGAKRDEIAKLDETKDAARLLAMQLLQTVGAERISMIPEAKYADVVAFIDAQRAQFA